MAERPQCLACASRESTRFATARDAEYCSSSDLFTYYRCAACRSLFIDPVPEDRLAEIYPPNYYAYASGERSLVFRAKEWLDARGFRAILQHLPGDGLRVLDVGGGDGWRLSALRRLDPRTSYTEVVDIDATAAERARAGGHHYSLNRIEDYRSEQRFDLILLLNLIEHVRDPARVLRTVREHLAPGGVVLVHTPNVDSLDARWFRHRGWGGYHCPRHWVLFDEPGFTSVAARAGLRVRDFRYTQGAPFWALSLLIVLARRGWVSITAERPAALHPLFAPLAALFAGVDLVRARLGGRPSQMWFELVAADP